MLNFNPAGVPRRYCGWLSPEGEFRPIDMGERQITFTSTSTSYSGTTAGSYSFNVNASTGYTGGQHGVVARRIVSERYPDFAGTDGGANGFDSRQIFLVEQGWLRLDYDSVMDNGKQTEQQRQWLQERHLPCRDPIAEFVERRKQQRRRKAAS